MYCPKIKAKGYFRIYTFAIFNYSKPETEHLITDGVTRNHPVSKPENKLERYP